MAIREARKAGLIAPGTAIWLCDDTPAGRGRRPGEPEPSEKQECCYTLQGQEFRHRATQRVNRMQMMGNLRFAFPDVEFVHR